MSKTETTREFFTDGSRLFHKTTKEAGGIVSSSSSGTEDSTEIKKITTKQADSLLQKHIKDAEDTRIAAAKQQEDALKAKSKNRQKLAKKLGVTVEELEGIV